MSDRALEADVAVVGGGPAGSATALQCAREGLRVVLVERTAFPRDRPGETLHPGAESALRHLGAWNALEALEPIRHEGIRIRWAGPVRFDAYGRDAQGAWRGIQAWRADLDRCLLDAARSVGVTILQPVAARTPLLRAGRVTGLRTSGGDVRAAFTVDASVGRHWLARQLRMGLVPASRRLLARYGYARGACAAAYDAPLLVAVDGGWTWFARIGTGHYAWTSLVVDGEDTTVRPAELGALDGGRVRTADVTWRAAEAMAGPGWLLVGDAATVVDPASSHGVLKALMSGAQAARVVVLALRSPDAEAAGLAAYERWLRAWFRHDVERLNGMYSAAFPSWTARGATDAAPS